VVLAQVVVVVEYEQKVEVELVLEVDEPMIKFNY
jgi:hypothetical protein